MSKQSGFTLIELVMVIVILGILGSIAVPKFVDLEADATAAAEGGMSGAVRAAHAIAIADKKRFPTLTELATYVTGDGVGVAGDSSGVSVEINGAAVTVPTFTGSSCTGATTAGTDVVQCVGGI